MAPTDYRTRDQAESTMEQVGESAREAGRRAVSLTEDIADAIRERPYTALAVAAGLALEALVNANNQSSQNQQNQPTSDQTENMQKQIDFIINELSQIKRIIG